MHLGLQLYTIRDAMTRDPRGTLSRIADLGLKWVELAGTYDLSNEEMADALKAAGLQASSSHMGISAFEDDFAGTVAFTKTLGINRVVVPWIDRKENPDPLALGKRLTAISEKLKPEGIELAYHNHAFELEGDKPLYLDQIFDNVDASLLKCELDLAWIQFADYEPVAYIKKYAGRTPFVHLKEFSGDRETPDAIAGEGWLNWDDILAECAKAGVEHGIIEMDAPPGDSVEAVGKCVEFFHSKGLS